jgi:aryl-alcohol dehydrogenase-like predicted oxidoreductase
VAAMTYRRLGRTGYEVSAVGCGTWAMGADWGPVDDDESMAALHAAVDTGVNLLDTADVYGDGRSEKLIGRFLAERDERIYVATKIGRRAPLDVGQYTADNMRAWLERCRANLGVETIDLVQLHCLPSETYDTPEIFAALDGFVEEGLIAHHGVSVETVDEGLRALHHPGVASVQIIFNAFRQKPADRFLAAAAEADVGVIARVPLASGLLTGKFSADESFPDDDHRNFNRHGEAFDVGETFAGVDLAPGVAAADKLADQPPEGATLAQLAIRWILMFDEVSTVIPGAKNPAQARENAAAAELPPLDGATMERIREVYDEHIAPLVHQRW